MSAVFSIGHQIPPNSLVVSAHGHCETWVIEIVLC